MHSENRMNEKPPPEAQEGVVRGRRLKKNASSQTRQNENRNRQKRGLEPARCPETARVREGAVGP